MFRKFIGDRAFYRRVAAVAVPIIIQNGITNFVSLLDNIMVGQVGTVQMDGVSIVNQLLFVFYLCIFGAVSGAGIFTAQFYGSGDHDGIRSTFRFKYVVSLLLAALGIGLFLWKGESLISLYLQGEGSEEDIRSALRYGQGYLHMMLWSLVPFAIANAYSGTLRETGQTFVPMAAGIAAVIINLFFNYVLIFGHFGAPAMGVRGAALATVISRFVEMGIVVIWTHCNGEKNPFIRGAYRSIHIPGPLLKKIVLKGAPLLLNETMWASGMALMNQCYSVRGLDVVAAMNINSTMFNLASVVFLSMGNVVGILIGQELGSGCSEKQVRSSNLKLTALSVASCLLFGSLMAAFSGLFPMIYNTTDEVRHLATMLICVNAFFLPFNAYTNATYFTLRSGGQTAITFLFDSCFVWVICVPLAYCLSRFTTIPIVPMYILCLGTDLIKCALGYSLLRSNRWIRNLAKA